MIGACREVEGPNCHSRGIVANAANRYRGNHLSAEPQNISEVAGTVALSPRSRGPRHDRQSTSMEIGSVRLRLFASRAGIHVDFHADRHFDDLWSLPRHFGSPLEQNGRLPHRYKDKTTLEIAQAGIRAPHGEVWFSSIDSSGQRRPNPARPPLKPRPRRLRSPRPCRADAARPRSLERDTRP
jgi:hypothetical protein